MKLLKTDYTINPKKYWVFPSVQPLTYDDLELFDQNGYDLCKAEQKFAHGNGYSPQAHRYRYTCKVPWYLETHREMSGPHLNHADIYFRRGFSGDAKSQLKRLAQEDAAFYKLIAMRPKWGVDMSVDYADSDGNVFELLHFEWDGFDYYEVLKNKLLVEDVIDNIDWYKGANEMLERKDEWHTLDFFGQSDWKQAYWGLPREQFKEVIWE
jgi:hypothetical protein